MKNARSWKQAWLGAALALAACGSEGADESAHEQPDSMQPSAGQGGGAPTDPTAGQGGAPADSSAGQGGGAPLDPTAGQSGGGTAAMEQPDGGLPINPGDGPMAWPDPRGGCPDLDTGFPGDDACLAPPPPGEGMQIHIGPTDYDDPAQIAQFVLDGGAEVSECWTYHTPNDEEIYYQGWTLSGRPGTHHIFNSMLNVEVEDGGGFRVCVDPGTGTSPSRIGSLPAAGKPYMPRTIVAPENAGVGRRVAPHTNAEADLHYFNPGEGQVMREFWLNLYFIPKDQVTDEGLEVRGMGGLSWSILPIAPGTDEVYKYECPISGDGRITGLAGHYHAHGKRQTVSIRRADGTRQNLLEMYHYDNAAIFGFDSLAMNPPLMDGADGAYTGRLDVHAGDVLEWECHVINDGNVGLTYSNNVQTGEMCNVFGVSVGPEINCVLP